MGVSCPSFPEPNSAWRAFSEGDFPLAGAQNPPIDLAMLRVVQDAGWLGRIRVTATQLHTGSPAAWRSVVNSPE